MTLRLDLWEACATVTSLSTGNTMRHWMFRVMFLERVLVVLCCANIKLGERPLVHVPLIIMWQQWIDSARTFDVHSLRGQEVERVFAQRWQQYSIGGRILSLVEVKITFWRKSDLPYRDHQCVELLSYCHSEYVFHEKSLITDSSRREREYPASLSWTGFRHPLSLM